MGSYKYQHIYRCNAELKNFFRGLDLQRENDFQQSSNLLNEAVFSSSHDVMQLAYPLSPPQNRAAFQIIT